jgi:hypothetical protein
MQQEDPCIQLAQRWDVAPQFQRFLKELYNYKIVLICDDSGSMNMQTNYGERRWDELYRFVETAFGVTEFIRQGYLDVHFLNRGSLYGIAELRQIKEVFDRAPSGGTPLVPALRRVLCETYQNTAKGRIIIIATDGEPTDNNGYSNINELKKVLLYERSHQDYVTFLACTDDDSAIGYLNQWDSEIPRVDVVDDYQSEKKEVKQAQGVHFPFSYGDYILKTMLGSAIPELDRLDESPHQQRYRITNTHQTQQIQQECNECIIV